MYKQFLEYLNKLDEFNEESYNYLFKLYGNELDAFLDRFVTEMLEKKDFHMIDKIEYYLKNRKIESFDTTDFNGKDPNLEIYFNDIARYPVLSSYAEKVLSNKIVYLREKIKKNNFDEQAIAIILNKYNYNKEIKRDLNSRKKQLEFINNIESDFKEKELFNNYVNYLELRETLINSNLRLVVSIANKYSINNNILDLIQVGNSGLMHAIDIYKSDKGAKFATYAYYWILQKIFRYLRTDMGLIKLPDNKANLYVTLKKYISLKGEKITEEEIIEFIYKKIYTQFKTPENSDEDIYIKAKEVCKCLAQYSVNSNIRSIDHSLREEESDEYTLQSIIPDNTNVESEAISYEIKNLLKETFEGMDKKMVCVLLMRKGLSVKDYLSFEDLKSIFSNLDTNTLNNIYNNKEFKDCYTLEEIGEYLGVTRERIRQIEKKAIVKIKNRGRRRFVGYI